MASRISNGLASAVCAPADDPLLAGAGGDVVRFAETIVGPLGAGINARASAFSGSGGCDMKSRPQTNMKTTTRMPSTAARLRSARSCATKTVQRFPAAAAISGPSPLGSRRWTEENVEQYLDLDPSGVLRIGPDLQLIDLRQSRQFFDLLQSIE